MKKRLFMTAVLLLSLISSVSLWAYTTEGNIGENISWVLTDEGILTITGTGEIPDYGSSSNLSPFNNRKEIKSAIVGEGITKIGQYCFDGCENLTSVQLPSTLKTIEHHAFRKCNFKDNSIQLPEGLETIETYGLGECYLDRITLPSTLKKIGSNAFDNNFITSVVIPKSVTQIGEDPFYGANDIAEISVEEGNEVYDSRNNCNAIIETSSNKLIVGCKNTVIPNTVKTIGSSAFSTSHYLTAIDIPNSVESIEYDAFYFCERLSSISLPENLKTIGNEAFYSCQGLTKVTMGNNVESIGNEAFKNCYKLQEITIPASVRSIGEEAFSNDSCLTSINIPEGITAIEKNTFKNCKSLTNITIPASVTTIKDGAFANCNNLAKINVLCPTPPTLGTNAFEGIATEVTLQIPIGKYSEYTKNEQWQIFNATDYLRLCASIKDIKDGLTEVKYYYSKTTLPKEGWNDYILNNEEIKIEQSELSEKIQKLPGSKDPFAADITSIEFDKSMQECFHPTTLKQMLNGGKNIKSIKGLEYLNTDAVTDMSQMFADCQSLTSLDLSTFDTKNVTTMSYMFKNCTALKDIYVSDKFVVDNVTPNYNLFEGLTLLKNGTKDLANYEYGNFQKKVGTLGGEPIGAIGSNLYIANLELEDGKDFVLTETNNVKVGAAKYTRTMSSTWGTLCLPYSINVNAETNNCKYYSIKSMNNEGITLEELTTVPAATPVLFCLNNTTSATANISGEGNIEANAKEEKGLVGTFTTQIVPDDAYFISKDAFRLAGAYKGNGTNGVKVGAYRAYLKLIGIDEDGGYAKLLNIMVGETTAIDGVQTNDNNSNAEYYDITGKRLAGLQKGLNIVKMGGVTKKVIVK